MVDVKSLFRNIPLSFTINIIAKYIYSPHHKEHPPIKKNTYIKLMHLSTLGMLLYNNKLLLRTVAVGCPLAPTMANFLLGHRKTKMLKNKHLIISKCMLDI